MAVDLPTVLLLSLLAAPLAPFYALILAALASNKVQGFAVSKGLGVLLLAPVSVYFVDPPFQWLFGIIPLYWPSKFLFDSMQGNGTGWIVFTIGLCYQLLLITLLTRRFNIMMQR